MVGLPGTHVVHPRMGTHLAASVAGGMTSTVRLRHPDQVGTRNSVTGKTTFAATAAYYDGPARVQTRGGASPTDQADRQVTIGDYLVAVPTDAGAPQLADLVEVVESPDPQLVGAVLIVRDVGRADILLQRNLGCDLHQATTPRG